MLCVDTIVIFFLIFFVKKCLRFCFLWIDLNKIYPSNFCVKGSGIRFKGKTPAEMKQEVYDYFLDRFKIPEEDINFVNLTYDVKDY